MPFLSYLAHRQLDRHTDKGKSYILEIEFEAKLLYFLQMGREQ